jgi:ribose 5-phosphate isomerase B
LYTVFNNHQYNNPEFLCCQQIFKKFSRNNRIFSQNTPRLSFSFKTLLANTNGISYIVYIFIAEVFMKIVIGSDRSAYVLKETIKRHLLEKGHEVTDVAAQDDSTQFFYINTASNVAKAVQSNKFERGIVICTTGMGVAIVANRHKGVYCALCESTWTVEKSRQLNNANILALGAGVIGEKVALSMVDTFIDTPFANGEPPERKELLDGLLKEVVNLETAQFK